MKITAAGDCAMQKNLPKYYEGFDQIKDYLMQGDVRFFNMETTVCEDCYAATHSGGTWMRTSPDVLEDALEYGFNVTTSANNHCMDYAYDGFLQTLDNFKKVRLPQCGGGRNLAEASRPVYLDTPNGRAAIIGCTVSYSPGAEAGEQSRDLPGRPGINPVRTEKVVYVEKEELEQLARIAEKTKLNAYQKILQAEGYQPPDKPDSLRFCDTKFRVGEPHISYTLSEYDMERIERSIRDAKFQADVVLVSVHNHSITGSSKEEPPEFLVEFAHRCIDAGAHAFLGHGPHLLQAVEIYKGLPIFYSLGDFILQLENCEILPDDYYRKYGLSPEAGIYEVFKTRTKDFTVGLQYQRTMMEAVIPYFEIEDGKLQHLEMIPIELGFGMKHSQIGWPRLSQDTSILQRLIDLSAPFGTDMYIADGKLLLK